MERFLAEQIGDPTLANGILDRLVHNAVGRLVHNGHHTEMHGESTRRWRGGKKASAKRRGIPDRQAPFPAEPDASFYEREAQILGRERKKRRRSKAATSARAGSLRSENNDTKAPWK